MSSTITSPKAIQTKSRGHTVTQVAGNTFQVTSGTSGETYKVQVYYQDQSGTCTCKWGQYRKHSNCYRSGCSHVVAVFDYLESPAGRRVSVWTDEEQARKQHRPMIDIGDGVILTSRKVAA
jgi:hypothetical protein